MILMVCIDDRGGMMFHGRRQSQDRVLRMRIVSTAAGRPLWMNEYSAGQFEDVYRGGIRIDPDPLQCAGAGEYCFVEDLPVREDLDGLEEIILYHWNRTYPFDQSFNFNLSGWELCRTEEFKGSSHDVITEEHYRPSEVRDAITR